jgi:UDPglucose 6-dehydrogenase
VTVCQSAEEACFDSEAIIIATDWEEFQQLDWVTIYSRMKKPAFVFDGRSVVDAGFLRSLGFKVHSVGKGPEVVDPIWA